MSRNTNIAIVLLVVLSIFLIYKLYQSYDTHDNLVNDYENLANKYDGLVSKYNELEKNYEEFQGNILGPVEENHTSVTLMYQTNFGQKQQTITLSVPYEKYDAYHKKIRIYWGEKDLTTAMNYITYNETLISQIVEIMKDQTNSEEELANAILNLVQDKGHTLSIRYYPTTELKYPVETLVEMGGDCDTHAFLYGTLMKAAGFKVLLLFSNEKLNDGQYHVATAIHLENPPENSLPDYQDCSFTYDGETYYYAETTNVYWRVGDLPPKFENLTFNLIPI